MVEMKKIPLDITVEQNRKLIQLKLDRSAEIGQELNKGFIVGELIDREYALHYPGERDPSCTVSPKLAQQGAHGRYGPQPDEFTKILLQEKGPLQDMFASHD